MSHARLAPTLALMSALAACGGGGGESTTTPPPPPPPSELAVDTSTVAVQNPASALPADWASHSTFMEIYVRGFNDSNGDGIGDLQGVIQKLPYLQDLGIKGIWLMPTTQSQDRDHGYAVSDYRAVEADYGSMADMEQLIREAHARGIAVILDYVMNHSAYQNPLFTNSNASTQSIYRNWYVWSDNHPSGWNIFGNDPWYSGKTGYYLSSFWSQMPDFNMRNPSVVAYHHNNLRFWLNKGVDGFRFDAVGVLVENGPNAVENQPESYNLMRDVQTVVKSYNNRYMVCEAPADSLGFGGSQACGSAFAFGHQKDLVSASQGNAAAIQSVAQFHNSNPPTQATILANHDNFAGARIYDQMSGDMKAYKLAAATYLTLPGIPFVYYGEEIGMAGGQGLSGDWSLRTPMSWTANASTAGFTSGTPFRNLSRNVATHNVAAEQADPDSLLNFYKAIIGLRNSHPALAQGSYSHGVAQGSTLSFQRQQGNELMLVVLNYGKTAASINVSDLPASKAVRPLYPASDVLALSNASGQFTANLPPQSVAIYQVLSAQ